MFILKLLRRKKNISQTDFASAIGVSLRTVQLYEKKGANIPMKNLAKIADFFKVSISELYESEVNETNIDYKKIPKKKNKSQVHTITKLDAGKYLVNAPLIISSKQGNYANSYPDISFLERLPKVSFVVNKVTVSNYVAFEIGNDSMFNESSDSLPNKTIVLGKEVSVRNFGKVLKTETAKNWIVVFENGVMSKQISNFDSKEKKITCHSLNNSPEYPDFDINLDEVKQLFTIVKRQLD